jgi:hypothetical protein
MSVHYSNGGLWVGIMLGADGTGSAGATLPSYPSGRGDDDHG